MKEKSLFLSNCTMLSLCVHYKDLSDCVYSTEGRLTSGSLAMKGELISPTATSQSLHIYFPPLQWPLPSRENNGTSKNCRWVCLKAMPYRHINKTNARVKTFHRRKKYFFFFLSLSLSWSVGVVTLTTVLKTPVLDVRYSFVCSTGADELLHLRGV